MSLNREERITCPVCGHQQSFVVWHSINVSVDPSLKEPLLHGRLTTFQCGRCSESTHVAYDLLYHDMDHLLAIWLKYPEDDGSFGIDDAAKDLFPLLRDRYVCRLVLSFQELVEKMRIFDDGFDDFFIELLKLVVCTRERIDITYPLYYNGIGRSLLSRRSISLVSPVEGEFVEIRCSVRRHLEQLHPILAKLKPNHVQTNDPWLNVNRQNMLQRLENAGLMRQIG
jgi:hypothetical protein